MANYTTAIDLVDDALDRAGEPTNQSSDFQDMAVRFLNRAYQELCSGGGSFAPATNVSWWWLRARGAISLSPIETRGHVAVRGNGNLDVSFHGDTLTSEPPWTYDATGYHLKVGDHTDVFKLAELQVNWADDPTSPNEHVTYNLDHPWTGDDVTLSSDFELFKIDYELADDVLSLMHPMQTQRENRQIHLVGLEELHETTPLTSIRKGIPDKFAMLDERTVRFNRTGPDDVGDSSLVPREGPRIDYHYFFEPEDLEYQASSVPVVPRQYRKVLADMVCFWLLLQKNDERANGVGKQAQAGIHAMVSENRRRWALQGQMGMIRPRDPRHPGRPADGPVRTESGIILG